MCNLKRAFAAILLILLAACGPSGGRSRTDLIVARGKDAVTLDPARATDGNSLNVTQEIMKGLVQFKPGTFDVEPAIAQSWSTSPDGRRWTFVLKPHLTFTDGTAIDADAVKFNFDRWRLISNPYHANFTFAYYASMFGGFPGLITDVRASGNDRVVFTLNRAFAPFLRDLAMPPFGIGSPKAIRNGLSDFAQRPVGYGPYIFGSWTKDDSIVLHANPNYEVKAAYETVRLRVMTPDQSNAAIRSGNIDIISDPTPADAAKLAGAPGVTIYFQPANNTSYLALNLDRAPFEKLGVRQAVADAIDVRGIVKAYYPKGALVADNWVPHGMLGENPSLHETKFDPAAAKAALRNAGYPNGFDATLFYSKTARPYLPQPEQMAQAIKRQLGAVGIRVQLDAFEWGEFLSKIHNGEHAMALAGWSGDNGDPDNFLYTLLDRDAAHRPSAQNYSFWRDARFHDLMIAGQATPDAAKRAALYRQASAMIYAMVPAIPIAHMTVPIAMRSSIAGYVPNPDTHIGFEYLYPR
jgi:peptide/nickel transport system substrate-binding protein